MLLLLLLLQVDAGVDVSSDAALADVMIRGRLEVTWRRTPASRPLVTVAQLSGEPGVPGFEFAPVAGDDDVEGETEDRGGDNGAGVDPTLRFGTVMLRREATLLTGAARSGTPVLVVVALTLFLLLLLQAWRTRATRCAAGRSSRRRRTSPWSPPRG